MKRMKTIVAVKTAKTTKKEEVEEEEPMVLEEVAQNNLKWVGQLFAS